MASLIFRDLFHPILKQKCSLIKIPISCYSIRKQVGLGKAALKSITPTEKKRLPVEADAVKLTTYVCGSNINKTGEDIKLKVESEYPEWLWKLHLGKPPPLEELDPNTFQYWRRRRKIALRRKTELAKVKPL